DEFVRPGGQVGGDQGCGEGGAEALPVTTVEQAGLHAGRVRHADALRRTAGSLEEARRLLNAPARTELAAERCREALDALGEIVGRIDNERMLDKLFASFCIGK
ncbi:MAG: tRNA uridine-5-carboxymethylaminomethyl(34) synthesis GTPase MnmE, partial [Verrucomicrobiota bacterium]